MVNFIFLECYPKEEWNWFWTLIFIIFDIFINITNINIINIININIIILSG